MTNFEITNKSVDGVMLNNKAHHDHIFLFATYWVKIQFKAFTSENLKDAYYLKGNPAPAEPRVFGSVFRELSRSGLIFKHSFELSKNPKCHCRPQQTWLSLEFRKKQQANRTADKSKTQIAFF